MEKYIRKYPRDCARAGAEEQANDQAQMTTRPEEGPARKKAVCVCGKELKNEKGLKIHQGKKGCLRRPQNQRTANAGETEDAVAQDEHHSGHSVQGDEGDAGIMSSENNNVEETINEEHDTTREDQQREHTRGEARRAHIKWPRRVEKGHGH